MSPSTYLLLIFLYFGILILVSFFTSKDVSNETFFTAKKGSPWFLVAFGMIGASLSGVTFISVPGEVGNTYFTYLQIVFGYLLGYFAIANILLPLYYKLNLTSIYKYLETRFGPISHKTGASFFILSRLIGSSFRLFLVAMVLYTYIFSKWNIPFSVTVIITIILIWVYSYRSGIKTIVYTDVIQTICMLLSIILCMVFIPKYLNVSFGEMIKQVFESKYSQVFNWDWHAKNNFFKYFFSGAFITIVMTGLDQDMMQKNLTCRNLKDARKNMYTMSLILLFINLLFLTLGACLYLYANNKGIIIENFSNPELFSKCRIELFDPVKKVYMCYSTDQLFPFLSFKYFPFFLSLVFFIGLIAAAYSSADSALTALTTSFCVDFLNFQKTNNNNVKLRYIVHLCFSFLIFVIIMLFKLINNESVINSLFTIAGYTYGPLLGLYTFGLFTKREVVDKWVPFIAVISPVLSYLVNLFSEKIFDGYKFGFELLILNGFITFVGLFIISKPINKN